MGSVGWQQQECEGRTTLETRLPYRFGVTMTSNCWGLLTNCPQRRNVSVLEVASM